MEFLFNIEKALGPDAEGFVVIDGKKGPQQLNSRHYKPTQVQEHINEVIDRMGAASSKA